MVRLRPAATSCRTADGMWFLCLYSVKGTTCNLHIYVTDVDASHNKAVAAGTQEIMAPEECQKTCDGWMAQMAGGGKD